MFFEFFDAKGDSIAIGTIKVGDTIYRKINGKLVAAKVISLNPFSTRSG